MIESERAVDDEWLGVHMQLQDAHRVVMSHTDHLYRHHMALVLPRANTP